MDRSGAIRRVRPARLAAALLALCLLLTLLAAPGARAERRLSIGKAAEVTERVAKRDCRRDPDCTDHEAGNCRRLARRRVSCVASIFGTDADGPYRCDRLVIVRLRDGGGTKHAAGKPSCFDV
jgi:hypothetical protein